MEENNVYEEKTFLAKIRK